MGNYGFWSLIVLLVIIHAGNLFGSPPSDPKAIAAEPLRLSQELLISGLAATALYAAGAHILGWTLGLISIIYHILVYLLGGTLLKQ